MGINPSGRGNNNDLWISGAHDQHPDVQDAGGPSGAVGPHRVSSQNNTSETPSFLSRISAAVSSFFSNIFGRSSSSQTSSSRRSSNASSMQVDGSGSDTDSIKSTGSTGSSDSARSTEGAARGLQKKGYTPGVKVDSPVLPRRGGIQRPDTPPPPPPSSPSTSGIRPVRPAPPPPTTAAAQSPSTSGTGSTKRRAPQPPTGEPKRARRDSISSISSTDSTVSTDSGVAESQSIADRLKAELEIHNTTKQAQLDSLSARIKDRWIEHEIDEPVAYGLSCMQTLTARLGQARLEAQKELRVLRPGINEVPLKTAISQSRSMWDLGEKEQKQEGDSVLFQVLIRMGLEGSLLSPEVDYVDYVNQLVEEYGDLDESYDWQPTLQSLAQDLNGIRNTNPNGMQKFWSSFAGKGEVVVRSLTNKFMAANTGKYDPSSVKVDNRWNRGALDLMKSLNPGVYVKTVSILAIDAFTSRE
ncbi:SemD/SinC family type III secretion system effector [Chlamydia sp. 04-14]|uniref:SemD/SinC family type III secretion system effector n=1 Tax=Chlamydia TaxID=810 RepID=UPI002FC79753